MYACVDRPVDQLGNGSRFVLWAMRAWANASRRSLCPRGAIGGAFVNMGAAAALPDFHQAMSALRAAPGVPLRFAPLACRTIVEDEAIMLSLWAMLVAGQHEAARATLRLMVPAATADLLTEALSAATDHLCRARLAPAGLMHLMNSNGMGGD